MVVHLARQSRLNDSGSEDNTRYDKRAQRSHSGPVPAETIATSDMYRAGNSETRDRILVLEDYIKNRRAAEMDLAEIEGHPTRRAAFLPLLEECQPLETPARQTRRKIFADETAKTTVGGVVIKSIAGVAPATILILVEKVFDAPAKIGAVTEFSVLFTVIGVSAVFNFLLSRTRLLATLTKRRWLDLRRLRDR